MSDDPVADGLAEETGLDVRSVAVIWNNAADVDGEDGRVEGPQLVLTGCSEYEAAGLLRAGLGKLERLNRCSVGYDNDEIDEEAEDA